MEHDLMARLAGHRTIGEAPADEHAWLAAHGVPTTYDVGAVVTAKGAPVKNMLVVLAGHLALLKGPQKIFSWRTGDVGGALPYSRVTSPPGDVVAEEPTELLAIARDSLVEMTRECPVVTAALVHAMVDRAREIKSVDLREEKLVSLGKIAAGLAHELNNPASAVVRSAKVLTGGLSTTEEAARKLAMAGLSASQFASIDAARTMCGGSNGSGTVSSVDRADREDGIAEWLADHDADEDLATALADTGVTIAALDTLAANVGDDALQPALQWLAASCLVRALASEIETAATRIHDLVSAVKGFTYMDHAPAPEPVYIRRGIADTFSMLGAKTRAKSAVVSVGFADNLPRVHGVGAELNQVWMNLIDNALDAVGVGGHVVVTGARALDFVVVQIVDDGPGIPPDMLGRIFDPFVTTKGVGKGTGLGLDIAKRLLQRHGGEISVESVPGRTEFQVRLPAEK